MEIISLKEIDGESKIALLNELGYQTKKGYILHKDGKKVIDEYIDEPVKVDNCLILPGSTLILDDNPMSIASYLEEFGDNAL